MLYLTKLHSLWNSVVQCRIHINPYSEPNLIQVLVLAPIYLKYILILASNIRLGFPCGLFPVSLNVKMLKEILFSFILATCLHPLDLITLTILVNGINHEVPYYEVFSAPHSDLF